MHVEIVVLPAGVVRPRVGCIGHGAKSSLTPAWLNDRPVRRIDLYRYVLHTLIATAWPAGSIQ
jgi:hypothetical protein